MDESISSAPVAEKSLSFSLRQIIAVTTSVAAAIALCYTLQSPPLGSSGLLPAVLPALFLAIALWFCRSDSTARLGTYAVVASQLALGFYAIYWSQTDWLFGHTHGPPQLIVATFLASMIGVLAGGRWFLGKLAARHNAPISDSAAGSGGSPPVSWIGGVAVVPLTLLSCLLALLSVSSLPNAMKRMDNYIKQRQIDAQMFAGMRARAEDRARETERLQLRDALLHDMAGTNAAAQYQAAATLLVDSVSEDREHRLKAVKILGSPPAGADTDKAVRGLLRVLSDAPREDPSRREAIRSLGKIGSAAAPAVPRLGLTVFAESTDADERAEAVASLAAMGPVAKGAAHFIGGAWREHRITLEQAQLLYKIDPQAAATFNIPRP